MKGCLWLHLNSTKARQSMPTVQSQDLQKNKKLRFYPVKLNLWLLHFKEEIEIFVTHVSDFSSAATVYFDSPRFSSNAITFSSPTFV